jgi:hypothetical protein
MPDGDGSAGDTGTDANATPTDDDVLERIGRRLDGSDQFRNVEYRLAYALNAVVFEFDRGYFPAAVERASLRVRWYTNADFTLHYTEQYRDGPRWKCRWDRTSERAQCMRARPSATRCGGARQRRIVFK